MGGLTIKEILAHNRGHVKTLVNLYQRILINHTIQVLSFDKHRAITLYELDQIYFSTGFATPFIADYPFRYKRTYCHFAELIGWAVLRHTFSHHDGIRRPRLHPISNDNCTRIFARLAGYLTAPQNSVDLQTSDKKLLRVVGTAMKMLSGNLCKVKLREASAIVAAWSPAGIYISDELYECVMGKQVPDLVKCKVYREFYLHAVGLLKSMNKAGLADSGRDMERIVYTLHHQHKAAKAEVKAVTKAMEAQCKV